MQELKQLKNQVGPFRELTTHCALEADESNTGTISHSEFTPADLEQLRKGDCVFYVKGVVFYDDDFGSRQHSTFCRVYNSRAFDGSGGFVAPEKPGYNYGT